MMSELKRCCKLFKYSYEYKDSYGILLFLVLGVLCLLAGMIDETMYACGAMWIVIGPATLIKVTYSLSYSNMVCASGQKKLLEIVFPNVWTLFSTFLGYLLLMMMTAIIMVVSPDNKAEYLNLLIWASLLNAVLLAFYGISSKYYWQGIVLMGCAAMVIVFMEIFWKEPFVISDSESTNTLWISILCFVITMVGAGISCLLRVLMYQKPIVRGQIGKKMLKEM